MVTIKLEVSSCADCPFLKHVREQGADYYRCSHKQSPKGWHSCISHPEKGVAEFCPLNGEGNNGSQD